ncbi:MAG TPA: Rieske 2Fe-2S domain-containing protein [Thermoleophilaceae bacterium]|nr:Rieske 2Fe-2S domain-containing protein [Thermoleophilaceae bacterium]
MRRLGRWLLALSMLRRGGGDRREHDDDDRIVSAGDPAPRAELVVVGLLLLAALSAAGFVVVYAFDSFSAQHQLLGITLGLSLAFVAAALILGGKRLIVSEDLEEDYPEPAHPQEEAEVVEIIEESRGGITRKKLLAGAGAAAGGTLGVAALAPALSTGPWFDTDPLYETPWERGRRLVDDRGKPFRAEEIAFDTFYTAFPEGADRGQLGAPLVVVRLVPDAIRLPPDRAGWAPEGILAYSKVCTHAGCAIALYRTPTFSATQPGPALVCPCHYSPFDPGTGGDVKFGPAGRNLPQLPLLIDSAGELRAGGTMSGAVGPSWPGVRLRKGES